MQQQMDRIRQTKDPKERQKLLQEHMQSMQEGMSMMRGMGGPMMMGMMGGQKDAMGPGMMGGGQKGGMGPGMMGGGPMAGMDPKQQQEFTQRRMDMMQMMMEQMMQHDQMMQPAPAK
jgi:hypothetical protein